MRLVFISSVTAMTPLRTISAITGSSGRRDFFAEGFFVVRAMAPTVSVRGERSPDGAQRNPGSAWRHAVRPAPDCAALHPGYGSLFPDRDGEVAETINLERVARHQ